MRTLRGGFREKNAVPCVEGSCLWIISNRISWLGRTRFAIESLAGVMTMSRDLQSEHLPFLHPDIVRVVEGMAFQGKTVAQFCCNNGRELLSLMQLGAERGFGFDLAENLIAQARGNGLHRRCGLYL